MRWIPARRDFRSRCGSRGATDGMKIKKQFLAAAVLVVWALAFTTPQARAQQDGQIKASTANDFKVTYYPIKAGLGNRDVAPADDGTVWFANQFSGTAGNLDPKTGEYKLYPLGAGSSPHGILLGPDGKVWVLEGGQKGTIPGNSKNQKSPLFP